MSVRDYVVIDPQTLFEWEEMARGIEAYICGLPYFDHESDQFKYGYKQAFESGEAEARIMIGES